jgi:DNA-binding MarR family transcriptional regulator/GNAT superfamily N-acetyltransferase
MTPGVQHIRSFNRFYTRRIGLLSERLMNSPFTLAEARVLYELAHRTEATAAGLSRRLGMDKAHLSRLLARLRMRGLVASVVSPVHAKHRLLSLTQAGEAAAATLERKAEGQMEDLLAPLDASAKYSLIEAMEIVRSLLSVDEPRGFFLRPPGQGDLGWILHRQAVLYEREYGWDWTFEGLLANILSRFVSEFDSAKEQAWIAECGGSIVGSVFLVRGDDAATAKLRMLYVEPSARGLGIGKALVAACITRAREVGYQRLTLWTHDILVAARRIYQAAGFRLVAQEPHHSFGHDLMSETWTLDLRPDLAGTTHG